MTDPARMSDAELAKHLRDWLPTGGGQDLDGLIKEVARRLTPAPDVMDEAGELCELLGWVGKEGAAKLSDVAAVAAFATRREAAARRELEATIRQQNDAIIRLTRERDLSQRRDNLHGEFTP